MMMLFLNVISLLLVVDVAVLAKEEQVRNADFMPAPRKPGEIAHIRFKNGTVIDPYAVQIGVPPSLSTTIQQYCDEVGITDLYRTTLFHNQELEPGTGKEIQLNDGFTWYLQRPELQWKSNMHWLSCNDERSHEKYASLLGQGGFDVVLDALGRFFDLDGLDVYSLGFIGVTHCEQGFMHNDFTDVDGKAFNILIPLELVEGSVPEFGVVTDDEMEIKVHYEYDVALVVGDGTMHGTGECDYRNEPGKMRMGMSIYLSDTNKDNVNAIIGDYTDPFPPADEEYLLSRAGRHWKKDGSAKLPKVFVEPITDVCNNDETCKPEWADYTMADFKSEYDCETVLSTERPILNTDDWMSLRKAFVETVGPDQSSIMTSPLSQASGYAVGVRVLQSEGKGRGVFSTQVIPKGSLVWKDSQTARFPNVDLYKKFLMAIPNELICDTISWSYVQKTGKDKDDDNKDVWVISTDLDDGALMNHGDPEEDFDSLEEAQEEGWDVANVGCIPEAAEDLPGGCTGHYFALREIQEGEELLVNYAAFSNPDAWAMFGF